MTERWALLLLLSSGAETTLLHIKGTRDFPLTTIPYPSLPAADTKVKMKRLIASLCQSLFLLILLTLIITHQFQKQPLIDHVLDSLVRFSRGADTASRSPNDLSFPYQIRNWSISEPFLVTPTSHQPSSHHLEKTARLTPTFLPPGESTPRAAAGLQYPGRVPHLPSALTESLISQVLQIDCNGRSADPASVQKAEEYVRATIDATNGSIPRLQCPPLNTTRYSSLIHPSASRKPSYFFAMNLYQSAHIIPQLFGAIIEAVRTLGPEHCVISVVEGRSTDGTFEILKSLVKEMEHLGVSYLLSCNEVRPGGEGVERISALAELRNLALRPLAEHPEDFDHATTVIFLNDIAPCAEDILELMLQRVLLQADMTCGMDWYSLGDGQGGTFYDSWIGRQMNGEIFFEVPQTTSWEFSKNLFWNHQTSKTRYALGQPLQVFSCWNGGAAIAAKPFMDRGLRFRTEREGECHLGEPVHLAKDLWKLGHGKIAVIPSVNVGYTVADSELAKDSHGWVSSMAEKESVQLNRISWNEKPPGQIKCLEEDWHRPSWEPFDLHK